MKIYHRKNFIWGLFGMLMGLGMEPKMVSTSVTEITLLVDEAQEYRATDALAKHFGIA